MITASRAILGMVAAFWLLVAPALSSAQPSGDQEKASRAEREAAETAALSFLARFEEGDLGNVYDTELSPSYRTLTARQLFVQQGSFMRLQSGGRAVARELVGSQPFTQTPTGQTGSYFYVRYRTRHPNGLVFQDLYLEDVAGAWKVAGFWTLPAPQQ